MAGKMISATLLIILIGFQCISGSPSPDPLVSSSGMIPLQQTSGSENQPPELSVLNNVESETNNDISSRNEKYVVLPVPEPETEDGLRIKKSPQDDLYSMFSNINRPGSSQSWGTSGTGSNADTYPLIRTQGSLPSPNTNTDGRRNPVVWANHVEDPDDPDGLQPDEHVVYSKERKAVLRPYISDASSVTIPTLIITPSTTQSSVLLKSVSTVAVPPQVEGRSIVMHSGAQENDTTGNSAIYGGEAPSNESSKILISAPKFVLVDESRLNNLDPLEDSEAASRIVRTSNDTTEPQGSEPTENPNPEAEVVTVKSNKPKVGPPWEDDGIVGKLLEDVLIEPTEVSFKVASKLCRKMARSGSSSDDQPKRYYVWAPINQYLPLLRKAFPVRPPLFAPECLKWVLRQCRGTIKLPLLKPCTYWAPMPIRRPECGFNPSLHSKIVNYRLPEFVPGNCPCVWPCTEQFDQIQRCRVTLNENEQNFDQIHSDGDPWNEKEILLQDYLAAQLCRGMKLSMTVDHTLPIGWIPIRADVIANRDNNGDVEHGGARRKRDKNRNKRVVKRDQVFLKPGMNATASSEEDDDETDDDKADRFTLMGTYNLDRQVSQGGNGTGNMTTIRKCNVWRYKACPKDQVSQETDDLMNTGGARRKRSIPRYMSRLALGVNGEGFESMLSAKRIVRQSDLDEDDILFNEIADCGEWTRTESYNCIPEEHVSVVQTAEDDTSSEESNDGDQSQVAVKNHKKKVVKNLCPGSVGKFPCFLRRKRSPLDNEDETVDDAEFEEEEGNSELETDDGEKKQGKRESNDGPGEVAQAEETESPSSSSSVYVINKIFIRPDSSCMCDWPCLPFFDRVNHCYNWKGDLVVDEFGRPKVTARSFRKTQRDPVVCIDFVEIDEIYCKIKD